MHFYHFSSKKDSAKLCYQKDLHLRKIGKYIIFYITPVRQYSNNYIVTLLLIFRKPGINNVSSRTSNVNPKLSNFNVKTNNVNKPQLPQSHNPVGLVNCTFYRHQTSPQSEVLAFFQDDLGVSEFLKTTLFPNLSEVFRTQFFNSTKSLLACKGF